MRLLLRPSTRAYRGLLASAFGLPWLVVRKLKKFDNATLADPLEPDYNGGRNIAKFYANTDDGRPIINSHAHGRRIYFLRAGKPQDEDAEPPGEVPPLETYDEVGSEDKAAWVSEMNTKYFLAREGENLFVFTLERNHELGRNELSRLSLTTLRNLYLNRWANTRDGKTGEPKFKKMGHAWLEHPKRREFRGVVFMPEGAPGGYYNLWQGFAVEPREGEWQLLRGHILEVICRNNKKHFGYFMDWLANSAQHPEKQAGVAAVLRGPRGSGKGMVGHPWRKLFGQHGLHISSSKHLVGNFNAHLRDCVALFSDEAFWAGDKQGESILKAIITEPVLVVEPKGVDAILARNCLHILMTSNESWVVPAALDERRFFVVDVDGRRVGDFKYFEAIEEQMSHGGLEAMLFELLHRDLSQANLRNVPRTTALTKQKMLSLKPIESWIYEKLRNGIVIEGRNIKVWYEDGPEERTLPKLLWPENEEIDVPRDSLYLDYIDYLKLANRPNRPTPTQLGIHLRSVFEGIPIKSKGSGNKERPRGYVFPSLSDARAHFAKRMGVTLDW